MPLYFGIRDKGNVRVLLVGSHPGEKLESMERFVALLARGMAELGHDAQVVAPTVLFRKRKPLGFKGAKWLYYVDKFVLFPFRLRRMTERATIIHLGDQGLGILLCFVQDKPHLITCHDLLCTRSLHGEDVHCPMSPTGKLYQRLILMGLRKAKAVAAVSEYTESDVRRFLGGDPGKLVRTIHNGLNYPYRPIPKEAAQRRLRCVPGLEADREYILHVGSSLERKNRPTILRTFQRIAGKFGGQLVFAGARLPSALWNLAASLGIEDRIVEVVHPENELLEALYNGAFVLFFPSFSEGFGWPVIEAQACGRPVLCSDIPSLREVAGNGAVFCLAEDAAAFATALEKLFSSKDVWLSLSKAALENVQRFSSSAMASDYIRFYEEILSGPTAALSKPGNVDAPVA